MHHYSPAVDVVVAVAAAVLLLLPLLVVTLLANGDAVIDEGAVVAADTVIGVDLGTKTGALMLSADMDEKTPDPVRGRRTLPLLCIPKCVSPLCHYAFFSSTMSLAFCFFPMIHLTFQPFPGVVMVCSIATISVHFIDISVAIHNNSLEINAPLHD